MLGPQSSCLLKVAPMCPWTWGRRCPDGLLLTEGDSPILAPPICGSP